MHIELDKEDNLGGKKGNLGYMIPPKFLKTSIVQN